MNRLRIGHVWEIGINESVAVEFDGQQVVVRRLAADQWVAYSRHCPHQNADLQNAEIIDGKLRCPWHGLRFQLESGICLSNQCAPLTVFSPTIENGEVFIYPRGNLPVEVQIYLARYGWDSRIGLFRNDLGFDLGTGADCVAETERGLENVSILSRTTTKANSIITGRIVRVLSEPNDPRKVFKHCGSASDNVDQDDTVPYAVNLLQEQLNEIKEGHQVIHVEFLLDGNVIAHLLGPPSRSLGPLAAEMSRLLGRQVSFEFAKFTE